MVRNIRIIAVIAAVMGGCGTTKPPPPKAKPAGAANAQRRQARQRPARRKNVDISADVMATAVFSSFEALLQRGISYVRPHLPKAARRLAGAGMLKAKLWSKLFRNAPGLESTLDLDRPFGLAVADPKIYRARGLGPLVLAVPLVDADKFVKILADAATHGGHRALDGGDHFIGDKVAGIYVRIVGRMAYVASVERLIQGAEGVMAPRLRKAPKLGGRLVVHMQHCSTADILAILGVLDLVRDDHLACLVTHIGLNDPCPRALQFGRFCRAHAFIPSSAHSVLHVILCSCSNTLFHPRARFSSQQASGERSSLSSCEQRPCGACQTATNHQPCR